MIDTADGIAFVRLAALSSALNLEVKTGMKMSRGINPFAIAKSYGYKGSKAKVAAALALDVEQILIRREAGLDAQDVPVMRLATEQMVAARSGRR